MTPPPGPASISSSCVSSDGTHLFVRSRVSGILARLGRPRSGLPQFHEHWTTKTAVFCPAGEPYPNGELRLDPVSPLDCIGDNRKWRRLRFQRSQLLPNQTELCIREPPRHAPDIAQLTLLVAHAEQQRTEKRARPPRFGPADDYVGVIHENSKFKMQNSNAILVASSE